MALISDTDFLIHNLRLSYLRQVRDPYGPRIITLDPSYPSNPYIAASSMADVDRWPELTKPISPNVSDDEADRSLSGHPGARRLKSSTTIGKSNGIGFRVNGKTVSSSRRMSRTPRTNDFITGGDKPVGDAATGSPPKSASDIPGASWIKVDKSDRESSPEPTLQVQQATAPEESPVAKVVQFVPKFKGAAEMEKRRQARMAVRRGRGAPGPSASTKPLSFDTSSEEEDEDAAAAASDSSSDGYEEVHPGTGNTDGGEDFDPVFAATRTTSDSASDVTSLFSAGAGSIPNSASFVSSSHAPTKLRPRLSPVSEHTTGRHRRHNSANDKSIDETINPHAKRGETQPRSRGDSTSTSGHSYSPSQSNELVFTKKKVTGPAKPLQSTLSSMLATSSSSSNPFTEFYAAISGRAETASMTIQVFFPHSKRKAMELNVRRDATVEEVIGYALWNYWEEGWLPKLDEGLESEDDPKKVARLSAAGWILRLAEDDGEVDDDFPAPDRTGKIARFMSDAYAILEASSTQLQQNQILESKIQRRPSRITTTKKSEKLTVPSVNTQSTPTIYGSTSGSMLSTSLGPSTNQGPQIFLRIRVADTADAVHVSTTIPVSAGMYMQEALELACRRSRLQSDPNDYALLLADMNILIPLDRTVASLQGQRELLLVKRSMLPQMGVDVLKGVGKTTDPNASIFKRMSDTPEQQYSSALDYTAAYKKYTIYRKIQMLVGRQERTLAIDGGYIHIMPTTNKAKAVVFDSGKTSSYDIKSIADCQQSAKTSSFKLIINRGANVRKKRYDFEAENPKAAAEIVQTIRGLKAAMERSGTVKQARRSRHGI